MDPVDPVGPYDPARPGSDRDPGGEGHRATPTPATATATRAKLLMAMMDPGDSNEDGDDDGVSQSTILSFETSSQYIEIINNKESIEEQNVLLHIWQSND